MHLCAVYMFTVLVLVDTQEGSLWSIVVLLRCNNGTDKKKILVAIFSYDLESSIVLTLSVFIYLCLNKLISLS